MVRTSPTEVATLLLDETSRLAKQLSDESLLQGLEVTLTIPKTYLISPETTIQYTREAYGRRIMVMNAFCLDIKNYGRYIFRIELNKGTRQLGWDSIDAIRNGEKIYSDFRGPDGFKTKYKTAR